MAAAVGAAGPGQELVCDEEKERPRSSSMSRCDRARAVSDGMAEVGRRAAGARERCAQCGVEGLVVVVEPMTRQAGKLWLDCGRPGNAGTTHGPPSQCTRRATAWERAAARNGSRNGRAPRPRGSTAREGDGADDRSDGNEREVWAEAAALRMGLNLVGGLADAQAGRLCKKEAAARWGGSRRRANPQSPGLGCEARSWSEHNTDATTEQREAPS